MQAAKVQGQTRSQQAPRHSQVQKGGAKKGMSSGSGPLAELSIPRVLQAQPSSLLSGIGRGGQRTLEAKSLRSVACRKVPAASMQCLASRSCLLQPVPLLSGVLRFVQVSAPGTVPVVSGLSWGSVMAVPFLRPLPPKSSRTVNMCR